jgi:hypothetical protein
LKINVNQSNQPVPYKILKAAPSNPGFFFPVLPVNCLAYNPFKVREKDVFGICGAVGTSLACTKGMCPMTGKALSGFRSLATFRVEGQ